MNRKEQQLRKLAESTIREDLSSTEREEYIRAFIENPPPDWEQLEDKSHSTVLSVDKVQEIMAAPAEPAFTTERLKVFKSQLALPDELCPARLLFAAFRPESLGSHPVCATAVIGFYPSEEGGWTPSCDWIEVTPESRRLGLGTELIDGIERHTGWILNLIDTEPYFLHAIRRAREARLSKSPTTSTSA